MPTSRTAATVATTMRSPAPHLRLALAVSSTGINMPRARLKTSLYLLFTVQDSLTIHYAILTVRFSQNTSRIIKQSVRAAF
ncbi:hypothetical protein PSP6_440002 [Paraburkholderia tropica]|nr:hypothetical protein PSP6_440002 [Paraburkholderia tropica]